MKRKNYIRYHLLYFSIKIMSFTFISIILNNSKSVKTCNFVSMCRYTDNRRTYRF